MVLTDQKPAVVQLPKELVLQIFHSQLERVKAGEIKRLDLVRGARVSLTDKSHVLTFPIKEQSDLKGAVGEQDIERGVQLLLNELTGEVDGWKTVNEITQDEPDKRRPSDNCYTDVLTWRMDTMTDCVQIGVDVLADERGEWERTIYLAHSRR
ncbi:MAG: hypothetical protein NTZ93_01830 [Candidatus Beckwithbacteria bacterium]|nr:hypothetical protein [Candidatus Beckwithbacteria bacterium]